MDRILEVLHLQQTKVGLKRHKRQNPYHKAIYGKDFCLDTFPVY